MPRVTRAELARQKTRKPRPLTRPIRARTWRASSVGPVSATSSAPC